MSINIAEQIGADDVQVSCPDIIVGEKGDTFDCDRGSGEDKATVG